MIAPGDVFGRLTVMKEYKGKYLCKCECGNRKLIVARNLREGKTKSCGCLRKENRSYSHPIIATPSKKQQITDSLEHSSLSWLHRSMK